MEPGETEESSLLPIVKLKPSMLKVALRHFLNPCFFDAGCVIVSLLSVRGLMRTRENPAVPGEP